MSAVEFPKMLYHTDGRQQVVHARAQQEACGAGWGEAPPPAAPPEPGGAAPGPQALDDLRAEIERLQRTVAQLLGQQPGTLQAIGSAPAAPDRPEFPEFLPRPTPPGHPIGEPVEDWELPPATPQPTQPGAPRSSMGAPAQGTEEAQKNEAKEIEAKELAATAQRQAQARKR